MTEKLTWECLLDPPEIRESMQKIRKFHSDLLRIYTDRVVAGDEEWVEKFNGWANEYFERDEQMPDEKVWTIFDTSHDRLEDRLNEIESLGKWNILKIWDQEESGVRIVCRCRGTTPKQMAETAVTEIGRHRQAMRKAMDNLNVSNPNMAYEILKKTLGD